MQQPRDHLALCYHAVSESARTTLIVRVADLRWQLVLLLGQGYEPVTFGRAATSPKTVAVTFDDGERNVHDLGLPVLAELGVPATVFVPVARIGRTAMSWAELAHLAESGWEIGSHTLTHARLPALDDAALECELRGSREQIEDALGRPCRSIAYPFGDVDERVRAAASRAGYSRGATTSGALDSADALLFPRVGVDGRDGRLAFRLKTSRAGRRLRGSGLGRPAAAVMRTVGR